MKSRGLFVAAVLAASPASASTCPPPGFQYAAFGDREVTANGNVTTDSYDSKQGSYASTKSNSDGDLGTNSTSSGSVTLRGNTDIYGNIDVGHGGSPGSVIQATGNVYYQSSASLSAPLDLPSVIVPNLGSNQGNRTYNGNGTIVLAPNQTYGDIRIQGNQTLVLSAGEYVFDELTIAGNGEIEIGSDAVVVYIRSKLDLAGNSVTNHSGKSTNLVFFAADTVSSLSLKGNTKAAYAVYAPDSKITVVGNSDLFGSIVGEEIRFSGNAKLHYDKALGSFSGGQFVCPPSEASRATPIVAAVSNQSCIVQGTFETPFPEQTQVLARADLADFTFPYIKGHMRARVATSIDTAGTAFSSGTILFDAATEIPPVHTGGCGSFTGACRNVFTTTELPDAAGRAFHPERVQLNDTTSATIGALIAPATAVPGVTPADWQTLVRRVLAGHSNGTVAKLGGVDRSTVAVIGPSKVAGSPARPTIAYFGATDGMIHAVCASTGGSTESESNVCPALGTELWAFLPRVQLPLIRTNTTRIDGSVHVVDAFGDFTSETATGKKSFRTILVFQTGFSDASVTTPAAYALDVTDPANPTVLWEVVAPSAKDTFELGVGLVSTAAPTLIGGKPTNLVVLHTNNGGTGGAGVVATALALETGARVWQFGFAYPTPPRGRTADLPLPVSGIPGGAVGVDLTASGYITDYVFGDLYGSLWRISASDGTSRTGTATPLFQFTTNRHPIGAAPAIFSNGSAQLAAFGTGGYADPLSTDWSASDQRLIAIELTAEGPYPLTEASTSDALAINEPLAAGEKAIAQALVVGSQLFLATDSSDVNLLGYGTGGTTGSVLAYDLQTHASTTVVVQGGASSLAASGRTLFNSSSDRQQQLVTSATSETGTSIDVFAKPRVARRLWVAGGN